MFTPLPYFHLKNRIMRSPTWEAVAEENGAVSQKLISIYSELASNDVALIIASHSFVVEDGRAGKGQIGIYSDELIDSHKALVDKIHSLDGKIGIQITHAGAFSLKNAKGPNDFTKEEIKQIEKSFCDAAIRANKAGYDIIMLHVGHAYLFSEFNSPIFNKRSDEYGGSIENRSRALFETVDMIRSALPNATLAVKMNVQDFAEGGMTLDESTYLVTELYKHGIVLFEASGGIESKNVIRCGKNGQTPYHAEGAKAWKEALQKLTSAEKPAYVACVGGIRSAKAANELIEKGCCDLISMARPFIAQPDIVKQWKENPDAIAYCKSCGGCFKPITIEEDFRCNLKHPVSKQ